MTYPKEVGDKLKDLSNASVHVPPVIGGHVAGTLLWAAIVQEVGQ